MEQQNHFIVYIRFSQIENSLFIPEKKVISRSLIMSTNLIIGFLATYIFNICAVI